MKHFKLAPEAEHDLKAIWQQVAAESERRADAIIDEIFERCEWLARYPKTGRPRPEIRAKVRTWGVAAWLIVYEPTRDGIKVVRVLHAARDLPSALE